MLLLMRAKLLNGSALARNGFRNVRTTPGSSMHLSTAKEAERDVVIVGGGAMGSSAAYWLKHTNPTLRVTVIEPDPCYRLASTGLSVGGFRQQFSLRENIQLSMYSIDFLKNHLAHELAVDGEEANIGLVEGGYLLLASAGEGEKILRENHATQRSENATVQILDPEALAQTFPWMCTDDIVAGSHGFENEGWIDPYALLSAFRKKARSLGVEYIQDRAVGFDMDENSTKIESVNLKSNGSIPISSGGHVINAAGPWAGAVAEMAGVVDPPLPVKPRKRMVFQFHCPDVDPDVVMPLCVDPTGVYWRSDGGSNRFLCGLSPCAEDDVDWSHDEADLVTDQSYFEELIWPVLAMRVPAFENLKVKSSWVGLYEYNTMDQNAIIGAHPRVKNLLFANGFSGHGIQQSTCVGLLLSELVRFGEARTVDVSAFSFQRIVDNKPILERCIV